MLLHTEGLDRRVEDHFERHDTFGDTAGEVLHGIGSAYVHPLAAGLWYGLSVTGGDDLNRQRSLTMLSALAIADATTTVLKGLAHSERPNGRPWSWPSGHATSSFTVASVLNEYYGWPVGVPAYATASVVAWAMMDRGEHRASDVLFGAALGCVVGHTVAGKHNPLAQTGLEITPYFGDPQNPAAGISLVKRF